MKILKYAVILVTVLNILVVSVVPCFAVSQGVDVEGYAYTVDDDGYIHYDYSIPLHNVYPYSMRTVSFFIDTDFIYQLEYIVEQAVPSNPDWDQVLNDIISTGAAGGAAAGSTPGGLAGVAASLTAASPGAIVLGAFAISTGIVCLTQPELVETVINDIYDYCDYNIQLALDEIYFQETWLIDDEIISEINRVLSDVISISDGVVWDSSIIVGTDGLTGFSESFYTDPPVVQNDALDALDVEFGQLVRDTWTTIDKNMTIVYKCGPEGLWDQSGVQRETDSSQGGYFNTVITIGNTATDVVVKFYPRDTDCDAMTYSSSLNYYIGEPVLVNDGSKTAVEIVYGSKKTNASYYQFVGNTFNHIIEGSTSFKTPIQMSGTGTVLDGQLITKVTYQEDTGLYRYKYKPKNAGNSDSIYKTVDLPLDPFHWVFSPSRVDTSSSSGAIDSDVENKYTDDDGKIITDIIPTIPQISEKELEMPKPVIKTDTDTDPDTGSTTITDTVVLPDLNPGDDNNVPDNPNTPDDPDDSDDEFKTFISDFFNFRGLFDWLPVEFSNALDAMVLTISGFAVALVINKIIRG